MIKKTNEIISALPIMACFEEVLSQEEQYSEAKWDTILQTEEASFGHGYNLLTEQKVTTDPIWDSLLPQQIGSKQKDLPFFGKYHYYVELGASPFSRNDIYEYQKVDLSLGITF